MDVRVDHMNCLKFDWPPAVLQSGVLIVLRIEAVDMPARMAAEVRQEVSEEAEAR